MSKRLCILHSQYAVSRPQYIGVSARAALHG
nr:MAG TPA: hypothetical protein [Bacteriophage sp.]